MAAASADTALKRTPLYDKHVAAGAKLVPFAGWEMPVQYGEGVKAEHLAVRATAGVFDVSHMGEIETSGPQAEAFLQHILSNDVTKLQTGGAQYSVLCREDGGVLDDLFTYRLGADSFLTVTNASNHDKDLAWFLEQAEAFDVDGDRRARPSTRCSPSRARRRARSSRRWPTARCPIASPVATACCAASASWSAAPATRARTASSC